MSVAIEPERKEAFTEDKLEVGKLYKLVEGDQIVGLLKKDKHGCLCPYVAGQGFTAIATIQFDELVGQAEVVKVSGEKEQMVVTNFAREVETARSEASTDSSSMPSGFRKT